MEDLIRRSDAISRKGVSAWLDNMGYPRLANAVMDKKRFPSADRPQGEWKINNNGWAYCSKCGRLGLESYNFCPNCGAMMKGADDGEDIQSADE